MTERSIEEIVSQLSRVLLQAGEDHLAHNFSQTAVELSEAESYAARQTIIRRLLALYSGGMGSFLDYVLQDTDGVLPEQRELSFLRSELFLMAQAELGS